MPTDSQIQTAALGWNNEILIEAILKNYDTTQYNKHLVFKTHPLDKTSSQLKKRIFALANEYNISQKVEVLQSGSIKTLLKNTSGVITINSTSAFIALEHRIPVLALGKAVYRHDSIVTIGHSCECIKAFLNNQMLKNDKAIEQFLSDVREQSLIIGDFYSFKAMEHTAERVVKKCLTDNRHVFGLLS